VQQPADDDHVIERLGRIERFPRRDLDPAARAHRRERVADHAPRAAHGLAVVAVVGGQPQHVDEPGERGEREVRQQHDAEADALRRRFGERGSGYVGCHCGKSRYAGRAVSRCSGYGNRRAAARCGRGRTCGFSSRTIAKTHFRAGRPGAWRRYPTPMPFLFYRRILRFDVLASNVTLQCHPEEAR